jgi:hypothetical protein
MAALLIGQGHPTCKPRHQRPPDGAPLPVGPALNQLALGGIKPEGQLDQLQDTL